MIKNSSLVTVTRTIRITSLASKRLKEIVKDTGMKKWAVIDRAIQLYPVENPTCRTETMAGPSGNDRELAGVPPVAVNFRVRAANIDKLSKICRDQGFYESDILSRAIIWYARHRDKSPGKPVAKQPAGQAPSRRY